MSYAQGQDNTDFSQKSHNVSVSIYPNPATKFIFVELNAPLPDIQFELNSLIGNRLEFFHEEVGVNKYKIYVENFVSGYYFITIKSEGIRFKRAFKFLKN